MARAMASAERKRDGIDNFRATNRSWLWNYLIWGGLHWIIGISAIVFSTAVASNKAVFVDTHSWLNGSEKYISAVCASLVVFFSAGEKSNRFMKARRILVAAIGKYDIDLDINYNYVERVTCSPFSGR
jgi:hypothetical protein